MRLDSWLGRFWKSFQAGVVQDVPASLEECETCRVINCTQGQWEFCARRLAAEAERLLGPDSLVASSGRTEEMPRVSSQEMPKVEQAEDDLEKTGNDPRSMSSREG
jgi:hypothetical protein